MQKSSLAQRSQNEWFYLQIWCSVLIILNAECWMIIESTSIHGWYDIIANNHRKSIALISELIFNDFNLFNCDLCLLHCTQWYWYLRNLLMPIASRNDSWDWHFKRLSLWAFLCPNARALFYLFCFCFC